MEFRLLGSAAVAVALMWLVLRFRRGNGTTASIGVEDSDGWPRSTWDALMSSLVVGLIAGRLTAMIVAGTNPVTAPADILIVRGGVDTVAAAIIGIATFAALSRAALWQSADTAAPAVVAGLAGWHGACLIRDTCLGTASDLPWAIAQDGSTLTRHPVEIYAALLLALGAVLLSLPRARPRVGSGVLGAGAFGFASLVRLATEPMRPGLGADLAPWYAGGAFVAAALIAWRYRSTRDGAAG